MMTNNKTDNTKRKNAIDEKPFKKIDDQRAKDRRAEGSNAQQSRNKELPASDKLARKFTSFAGSNIALLMAGTIITVWVFTGPIFNYSDTWQLVINTGTTIITFLMVFIIQRAQNKDSIAIHLKLNEIVASLEGASNRLIDCEDLSEKELKLLEKHYSTLADRTFMEDKLTRSHSIEEAETEIAEDLMEIEEKNGNEPKTKKS
ncbi:hypothetical protein BH10BAC5_BH10BAC5_09770 [soil metagenome]